MDIEIKVGPTTQSHEDGCLTNPKLDVGSRGIVSPIRLTALHVGFLQNLWDPQIGEIFINPNLRYM